MRMCACVAWAVVAGIGSGAWADLSPLVLQDVNAAPAPTLTDLAGTTLVLRAGTPEGAAAAAIRIETATGGLLLELRGQDNMVNAVNNPAALGAAGAVRLVVSAGAGALVTPDLDLKFTDGGAVARTLYLPPVNLASGQSRVLWVGTDGATFDGAAGETSPNFGSLVRGATGPWIVRQPGFRTEQVATGLQLPVAVAFVPGATPTSAAGAPWCYVAERYGSIKLVRRNGAASNYAAGLLNFTPGGPIPGAGEQGIGGMCVEPVSGDVFVSLMYDPTPPSATRYARVIRLHSTDGGLTSASQMTVLDMAGGAQELGHQVGGVWIGGDGKLYVANGDGTDAAAAQDSSSFKGKILRMNLDGSAPSDNPLYDGPPFTAIDYVRGLGVRSPLGGAWRYLDSSAYFVDGGPTVDRLTKLVSGRNYLSDGTDAGMANFALYNWPALGTAPNQTNVGAFGMAVVQSQTFGGSGLPATLYGRSYITEAGAGWIAGPVAGTKRVCEFNIDSSGSFVSGPLPLVEYGGTGRATCSGIAAGPDGVYFTDLYKDQGASAASDAGADLVKVKYIGFAGMIASPTQAASAPLNVQFTDTSTAPGASAWSWSFGDGTTSTLRNPAHTYTAAGLYTVRLTVTGSTGAVTVQRAGLIRIGQPPAIALIGGTLPASAADTAVANYLTTLGYQVTLMDDEPANRPGATLISQSYNLVVVSSSITSTNVAGEFRTAPIPMVFWESSNLRTGRESLADNGTTASGQTQITVTDNTHPLTQGLALGNVAMFPTNQTMSYALGNIAPAARVLATRVGQPTQPTILIGERGTSVVGNYILPERRAFLFFDDTSFNAANASARQILSRATCWALHLNPEVTTPPGSMVIQPGANAVLSVTVNGQAPFSYQWRRGGVALVNGGRVSGATSAMLTITGAQIGDSGGYDVVVTNSCASGTSVSAQLTVGCPADFNASGAVTVQDIFDFLTAYFSGGMNADFNHSGSVSVQDIFDFLGAYFTACS